jgi:hypothetical protein
LLNLFSQCPKKFCMPWFPRHATLFWTLCYKFEQKKYKKKDILVSYFFLNSFAQCPKKCCMTWFRRHAQNQSLWHIIGSVHCTMYHEAYFTSKSKNKVKSEILIFHFLPKVCQNVNNSIEHSDIETRPFWTSSFSIGIAHRPIYCEA